MTPTVSVLGLGNWGTALAEHLSRKGLDVLGWSIERAIVEGIRNNRRNPSCLSSTPLSFSATDKLDECLARDFLVLVVPSGALGDVVPQLSAGRNAILVSAIKGFEKGTSLTPLQFIESRFPEFSKLAVLSGPSFAADVIEGKPCGIVAASRELSVASAVADLFSSASMKVYTSRDPLGVELGGAVKNVIALVAGVSDGLNLGESARAGLITRGLAEMMRLAEAMGGTRTTLTGLSGLGDLAMTASSSQSRNHTVGFRLGRGESLEQIVATLGSTAEGVSTTPIVLALAEKYGVDMPITAEAAKLISGAISAKDMAKALMTRPIKEEFGIS